MSQMRPTRVQRSIQRALDEAGLDWNIVSGKKHRKLYVGGRMIMVFSQGTAENRDIERVRSFIRRAKDADPVGSV